MLKKSAAVLILPLLMTIVMTACGNQEKTKPEKISVSPEKKEETAADITDDKQEDEMTENMVKQIKVQFETNEIIYELNNSPAAEALYNQLPLSVDTEDFSTNEKIFYPEKQLDISGAPMAEGGEGVLAYYEPWGNVVMFYDSFNGNDALYELGIAVSGAEQIQHITGSITVDKVETNQ